MALPPRLGEGNVLTDCCMSVCLSVCKHLTEKVTGGFSLKSGNKSTTDQRRVDVDDRGQTWG